MKPTRRSSAMIPDFFLVGQPKTGSSALYHMLQAHPDICMASIKEPNFFAPELAIVPRNKSQQPRPMSLAEYQKLFVPKHDRQLLGEASVLYFRSHLAAQRIAELNPRARIIVVLREPASLLRSLHLQFLQTRIETVRSLRRALALESRRRKGRAIPRSCSQPSMLYYSEHVRYLAQLERFRAVFPTDQILVLLYDEFALDYEQTLRDIFSFLHIDPTVRIPRSSANESVGLRVPAVALNALARASTGRSVGSRAVREIIKTFTPEDWRKSLLNSCFQSLFGTPPLADERLMVEIRRRYGQEVELLANRIDRDLEALWMTNEPGITPR